jgi:hypothetical protein
MSGAVVARLLAGPGLAIWVAVPGLFMLGSAVLGHLITFDDDFPGGWSNPGDSWQFFRQSVYELLGKAGALALLVVIVVPW